MSPSLPPYLSPPPWACFLLIVLTTPTNSQFLKTLPDTQILSEEQVSEMPNQHPAFGALS